MNSLALNILLLSVTGIVQLDNVRGGDVRFGGHVSTLAMHPDGSDFFSVYITFQREFK